MSISHPHLRRLAALGLMVRASMALAQPAIAPIDVARAYLDGGSRGLSAFMAIGASPDDPMDGPRWTLAFDRIGHDDVGWLRLVPILDMSGCAACTEVIPMALSQGLAANPGAVMTEVAWPRPAEICGVLNDDDESPPARYCPDIAHVYAKVRSSVHPTSHEGTFIPRATCLADIRAQWRRSGCPGRIDGR